MLKQPRIGGAAQLRLFVQELGFERACKVVACDPSTMRAWLREARPVPPAALQALYWLTHWGFSDACAEAHWSHQYLVHKVQALERALEWRAEPVPAANDAVYDRPPAKVHRGNWWAMKPANC